MNYFENSIKRIVEVMVSKLDIHYENEYLENLAKEALLKSPKCNHERNNADWVITYLANDAIKLINKQNA